MSDWGMMILMDNGEPFVTSQSIPMALYAKQVLGIGTGVTVTQSFPSGRPIIPFVCTTTNVIMKYQIVGNICTVTIDNPSSSGATAYVYFFSIFQQPLPSWGLAIWDAVGTCILTNETRILTDIEGVGNNGVEASSGYNINITRSGKWACVPSMCGLVTGIIHDGGTRPFQAYYHFSSVYNGSSSIISSKSNGGAPAGGNVTDVTYHNMRNKVFILNVSGYD